ncbi:GPROR8 family protein [Megaselia abdita]
MYLINAINSSTFLEVTALTPCIGFCILGIFKLYIVWTHRRQLTSLIEDLKDMFPIEDESQTRFKVSQFLKKTNGVEYPYLYVLFFGMGAFNCFPLCSSIYEHFYLGMDFKLRLSFYMWYPFKIDTRLIYGLVMTQQWHAGFIAAFCFLATDIFLFSVIVLLVMTLTFVSNELRGMTLRYGDKDLIQLKPLIIIHQKVLEVADLTSSVFSITVLFNFISSTAMICFTAFQITSDGMPVTELGRYLIFLTHQILQVGTICYLGEMLIDAVGYF